MEHSFYVGSTHAVKRNADGSETVIPANADGFIGAAAGDVLVFKNYRGVSNVAVMDIVFRTGADPLLLKINDNELYTYIIPANTQQGITGLPIYRITVLGACTFAYDALA